MKKSLIVLKLIMGITLFLLMNIPTLAQNYKNWNQYTADIYKINNDQDPSIWVQMVLKEVKNVFYCSAEMDIDPGTYEVDLKPITNNFFQIKGTGFYVEINQYLGYRTTYKGILEAEAMVVQSPYDGSSHCVGMIYKLFLPSPY